MAPCFMQGLFAALAEVMGADGHHHGVPGGQPCMLALLLALAAPWCASNRDASTGRAEGQSSHPSPAPHQPPGEEPQWEPFLTAFLPLQTCPCLCEHARPRQHAGYPRRPRSHTHNPWVMGDTKEVPRRWELGWGQEGQPGRAGSAATASFLSH